MPSQIDILNKVASLLGQRVLTSLTDQRPVAVQGLAVYDQIRQEILTGPSTWTCSVKRGALPARPDKPASGPYTTWYDKPADCLRVLLVGGWYPGLDLSDYRDSETDADWQVEGGQILCDQAAPLPIKYVTDLTNVALMHPQLRRVIACDIAYAICQVVTGSDSKQGICLKERTEATDTAKRGNAFEKPPVPAADDTWIAVRIQQ